MVEWKRDDVTGWSSGRDLLQAVTAPPGFEPAALRLQAALAQGLALTFRPRFSIEDLLVVRDLVASKA